LRELLLDLGVAEENLSVAYNVIDKVERDSRDVCLQRLQEIGLDGVGAGNALALTHFSLDEIRERYRSHEAIARVVGELDDYFDALRALGFGAWVQFDMKIVRGLAYYTGIVFEIFDRKGALRAICGGGRYDRLFSGLAAIDIPALGFGFGDVVLGELLKDRGLAAETRREVEYCVIAVNDAVRTAALEMVASLRRSGHSAMYPYRAAGVGKSLKAAAAAGAKRAILIGPDELAARVVVVKDLSTGTEARVPIDELHGGAA
ncbi:MAG TPA: ATP phosphoribosyltransferase regulatory subunit, partial [Thermoanaerobaculia bacterium]|nr:ATP phosphoribosyltransferase regulatory subunit [Thermoanaerobaculia bacterium]